MEKKNVPKFSAKDEIGYVCGDMAGSFANLFIDSFYLTFCTYVLGIEASWMASLFLFSRLFDAINDPIIGSFPDRWMLGKSGEKFNYIEVLKAALKNRPLIGVMVATIGSMLTITGLAQLNSYIYKEVYQNTDVMTLASLATIPIMIIAFSLVPKLVKKFGKKNVIVASAASGLIFGVVKLVIYIENVYVFLLLYFLTIIGQMAFTMLIWALVSDCLDYSEWKMNIRSDGSMYSLYTFSHKIGSTIASTGVAGKYYSSGYLYIGNCRCRYHFQS